MPHQAPKNTPLPLVYAYEAGAALASTVVVAPFIAIVDKAIFSNASGKEPLVQSIQNSVREVVMHPVKFLRSPSFWWIWLVYGGTYTIANWTTVTCERTHQDPAMPKFAASSTANVSLSLAKDRAFSRMYGVVDPKPVPTASLGLFAARDSMSILASFTLPTKIAHYLERNYGWDLHLADTCAQLTVPLVAQIFSTPLHLLGMDLYNRPGVNSAERWQNVGKEYVKTTLARMARVLPAFGAGGVLNKAVRKLAHEDQARKYGYTPTDTPVA